MERGWVNTYNLFHEGYNFKNKSRIYKHLKILRDVVSTVTTVFKLNCISLIFAFIPLCCETYIGFPSIRRIKVFRISPVCTCHKDCIIWIMELDAFISKEIYWFWHKTAHDGKAPSGRSEECRVLYISPKITMSRNCSTCSGAIFVSNRSVWKFFVFDSTVCQKQLLKNVNSNVQWKHSLTSGYKITLGRLKCL